MPLPSPALTWTSLTGVVNLIKRPGKFVSNKLRLDEETLPTETVEIGTLTGGRDVAPFVRKGAEGVMVGGLGQQMYTVQAPNIRIKRPFRADELLFGRSAGTVVFPTEGEVIDASEQRIARDLEYMTNLVENAEEWMACMALRGSVSYSVADQEVFTLTFARSGSHSITLGTFWDQNGNDPISNIRTVKSLVSEDVGLGVTDALCGSEAATQFLSNANIKAAIVTTSGVIAGGMDITQAYRDDGACFLGRFMGIDFWEYPRKLNVAGVSTDLIRPKWIEFISSTPAAEWKRYYGAIPDIAALLGRNLQSKRFSKSWLQEDPSALMALLHSRPLVVPRIPDSTVSMKVVSG